MNKITLNIPGINDYFTEEAVKVLRTNLQFCGQDIKVINITSCNENEGKTFVSLHLAKSLAEIDKRVLVIDADMRKSVMAGRNTDAQDMCGLSEVLTGMKDINDCLCKTQFDNLYILFSGKYPPNPVELLSGKYFANFIEESRKIFDYVIIDTPPLGLVIDSAVVSTKCDGAILLIGNNSVRYRHAKQVVDQIEKSGCKVLGVVRNHTAHKGKAYYRKGYGRFDSANE